MPRPGRGRLRRRAAVLTRGANTRWVLVEVDARGGDLPLERQKLPEDDAEDDEQDEGDEEERPPRHPPRRRRRLALLGRERGVAACVVLDRPRAARAGGVAVVRLGLLDLDPVVRRRVAEDQHAAAGRAGSKLDQRRGLDEFARIGRAGAVVVAAAILLVLRELEDGAAADGVRRIGEEVVGGVGGAVGAGAAPDELVRDSSFADFTMPAITTLSKLCFSANPKIAWYGD